jgi:hypothetical protein
MAFSLPWNYHVIRKPRNRVAALQTANIHD